MSDDHPAEDRSVRGNLLKPAAVAPNGTAKVEGFEESGTLVGHAASGGSSSIDRYRLHPNPGEYDEGVPREETSANMATKFVEVNGDSDDQVTLDITKPPEDLRVTDEAFAFSIRVYVDWVLAAPQPMPDLRIRLVEEGGGTRWARFDGSDSSWDSNVSYPDDNIVVVPPFADDNYAPTRLDLTLVMNTRVGLGFSGQPKYAMFLDDLRYMPMP